MYSIQRLGLQETIRLLLPRLQTAGATARRIQQNIKNGKVTQPPQKPGNQFAGALTDADMLIEDHIGMAIGELFLDASFYGEEHEQDRISAYLPKNQPFLIGLDPIDGTRFYKDGLSIYDIIMTISHEGHLVAAIDYRPAAEVFYIGITGLGAFMVREDDVQKTTRWERFSTKRSSSVILTYRNEPAINACLKQSGLRIIQIDDEYVTGKGWDYPSHGIITGEIGGLYRADAQLIDWVALAFIASLAGGAWNCPAISGEEHRARLLIAANSPELYQKICTSVGRSRT